MLFYGPPGTGKTSTILALSRQLFGYAFAETPLICDLDAHQSRQLPRASPGTKRF
jgi:DNA polymerase III delta prime subunit